jgi:Phage protein Gp138 N-terminal domain/GpV Apex motif
MDQRERIGNYQEGLRTAIEGAIANLWTALPGIVQSFNPTQMTVVVRPTVQGLVLLPKATKKTWVNLPLLLDCPVVFPCAGGFALTLPIQAGDEVLVIFASRCIDAWWQQGGVQVQAELRMHDLSDGFAIPGPRSVPNALANISTNSAQIRNLAGTEYIELAAGGIVNIVAPGGVNINGDVSVTGKVSATKNGTFNGIDMDTHVHTGVQTGSGTTGPPTG